MGCGPAQQERLPHGARAARQDIGAKTDKNDSLKESELKELLAFDPSKTALGKEEENKVPGGQLRVPLQRQGSKRALGGPQVITEQELAMVLDREGGEKSGKGFMAVQKVTNSFDALNSKG